MMSLVSNERRYAGSHWAGGNTMSHQEVKRPASERLAATASGTKQLQVLCELLPCGQTVHHGNCANRSISGYLSIASTRWRVSCTAWATILASTGSGWALTLNNSAKLTPRVERFMNVRMP